MSSKLSRCRSPTPSRYVMTQYPAATQNHVLRSGPKVPNVKQQFNIKHTKAEQARFLMVPTDAFDVVVQNLGRDAQGRVLRGRVLLEIVDDGSLRLDHVSNSCRLYVLDETCNKDILFKTTESVRNKTGFRQKGTTLCANGKTILQPPFSKDGSLQKATHPKSLVQIFLTRISNKDPTYHLYNLWPILCTESTSGQDSLFAAAVKNKNA